MKPFSARSISALVLLFFSVFALVLPAIFLGVAAFLVNLVLGRLVAQQRDQVGRGPVAVDVGLGKADVAAAQCGAAGPPVEQAQRLAREQEQAARESEELAKDLEEMSKALDAPNPTSSMRTSSTFGAPAGGRSGTIGGYAVSGSFASYVVRPGFRRCGIGSIVRAWRSWLILGT